MSAAIDPAIAPAVPRVPLLAIQDLHVNYGAISALQGVSLEVFAGEIVALIGSNGAGKTTLLRTISGLLRPKSGDILWKNESSITALPAHEIVRLGICHSPEGRQIFANLSVRENLLLGAYQQRSRAAIRDGIDRCYLLFPVLQERREQRAGTLSGGEQQMLAIGRALMARPQVLLLDEPSLGLAPLIVRKIFQIVREINGQGTTVFLVEQNAHMALNAAHRGYVLQTGKVVLTDVAAKLLQHPDVQKAYLGG
ncbi:MAG TPA: ABC transporter ATP-binding protein [Humisphaera sp.]|jgi:branched-chain amino acid transport system ATP-binding protein|nr:ABC transporter ATP-binding protein [Humisphaera sp.]